MAEIKRGPGDFRIEDLVFSYNQEAYVEALFTSRGVDLKGVDFKGIPTYLLCDVAHSGLVMKFFDVSGYGPETKLGQFVQAIACLDTLSMNRKNDLAANEISKTKTGTLSKINSNMVVVQGVIYAIGKEIFGDEAWQYMHRIKEDYFIKKSPDESLLERRERREKNLNLIVDDIKEKFPLTSR